MTDIGIIADKIKENIRGDKLLLGDKTTGIPHIMSLFYGYTSEKQLELREITYSFEKDILSVGGSGVFPGGISCSVEMVFWNDEEGVLQVDMPRQYLFREFSPQQLSCRCAYGQEAWLVSFVQQSALSAAEMLAGGISCLGISVPASCFGEAGDLYGMRFSFEIPFEETGTKKDDFTNFNKETYFSLYFDTTMRIDLSGVFAQGEQVGLGIRSFQMEKFGELSRFFFAGSLNIWDFVLPFTVRYGSGSLTLAAEKDEKSILVIPAVNDLGKIIGLDDLHLPESFSSLSQFGCETISLSVSEDFRSLLSFTVVISNQHVWQISQEPDIHITDLRAGFTKNGVGTEVFISGQSVIAGTVLTLSAAYHTRDGWVFRCFIGAEGGEKLSLGILFEKLCDFLGFGTVPFPLPDQEITGAMAAYFLQTKEFSAHMEIGKLTGDFRYFFASSKSYCLRLRAGYELKLSGLPVVGEDLRLLDGMTVKDIGLEAGAGSTVLELDFSGEKLVLELAGEKREKELMGRRQESYPASAGASGSMNIFWFRMEKHCSVFTIHRMGIGFDGEKITFAFDAELEAGAFRLALDGLAILAGLARVPKISFCLSGMSVGFCAPALSISGGFRHTEREGGSSYDGSLLVGMKGISVFMTGAYGEGSFLAYGILRARLGGPPAFSVTGLAVGFGIHKYLMLPPIEEVEEFPLVAAAAREDMSAKSLLDGLRANTEDLGGQNFFAAGVRFHSFGMAYSFALLTVSFGQHMEIALLGICEMTAPPMEQEGTKEPIRPLAKARLALRAALLPESGVFSVEAQLMPGSYILSESCRLSGGFACCVWYAGEHGGDFVITLGGYRKGYGKPAHYPDVPRVGFHWDVTPELKLSGEMYFALTPSMLCAGGRLDAVFAMGALRAWFTAYADFEMGWKPFYYDINVGISLGASITLDLWLFSKTFTLEMAVDLHLWGPEFHGRARITWWVISFTIAFGTGAEGEKTIDWSGFKNSFLQDSTKCAGEGEDEEEEGILSIHAAKGVIGTLPEGDGEIGMLHADTVVLDVESLIPGAALKVNGVKFAADDESELGVYPMGENVTLASEMDISVETSGGKERISCRIREVRRSVPKALWAKQIQKAGEGEEASEMIRNVPVGAAITFVPKDMTMFPAEKFLTLDMLSEYEKIEKEFGYTSALVFDITGKDTGFEVFRKTADGIPDKVGAFAKEMETFGFHFDISPDLSIMAEHAEDLFDEAFWLGGFESLR